MPYFEYLLAGHSARKTLVVRRSLRKADGSLAADRIYDPTSPEETASIEAEGMTYSEAQAEMDRVRELTDEVTFTFPDDTSVTGYVESVNIRSIKGSALYQVVIDLVVPYPGS